LRLAVFFGTADWGQMARAGLVLLWLWLWLLQAQKAVLVAADLEGAGASFGLDL